jgi:ribosomal protein S18 acetylase RimI-like enzyme
MQYRLRPVTEADREWLYELKVDAYRDVIERQFGSWADQLQRQIFDASWNLETSSVISVGQTDVGLLVVEDRPDELWLAEIQLGRTARGHGLGSRIVEDLLNRARAAGKPLRLNVLCENHRARRLYESLGFARIGETDEHYVMQAC